MKEKIKTIWHYIVLIVSALIILVQSINLFTNLITYNWYGVLIDIVIISLFLYIIWNRFFKKRQSMIEKPKTQKGFIQIPLLIAIIVAVIVGSGIGAGAVLYKQGKLAPLVANISQIFKNTEPGPTKVPEISPPPPNEKPQDQSPPSPPPRIQTPPSSPSPQKESPEIKIEKCKTKAEEYAKSQSDSILKSVYEKLVSACSKEPSPEYLEYQKKLQEYIKSCGSDNPNQTFSERLQMLSFCIQMFTELQKLAPPSPEDTFLKCQKDSLDFAKIAAQREYPRIYNEFYLNCLNQ